MSLNCHVDIDFPWMVCWEDRRNVETGSPTGVFDWRSVLCGVALLSRLPEVPDTDCLNCFSAVGKNCVLDLNARKTYNRVRPPECGLEAVAQMPPIQHCWVAEMPSDTVAWEMDETQDAREMGVSPGEMEHAEGLGYIRPDSVVESPVYVWSLLSGSPLRRVRGLHQLPLPSRDPTWIVLVGFWLYFRLVWWSIMSSGLDLPVVDQAGAATTASTPLPGTFLGLALVCMTWLMTFRM